MNWLVKARRNSIPGMYEYGPAIEIKVLVSVVKPLHIPLTPNYQTLLKTIQITNWGEDQFLKHCLIPASMIILNY